MELEVLVATLQQKDLSLTEKMHLTQNAVIANQCGQWSYTESKNDRGTVRILSSDTKGVGINRNLALQLAQGDILLFADDDVTYIKVDNDHAVTQLAEGKLTMQDGKLTIGEHTLLLSEISNMAIVRTNRLIFSMNGEYYELKSQVRGRCVRKYLLAWQNAKAAKEAAENYKA